MKTLFNLSLTVAFTVLLNACGGGEPVTQKDVSASITATSTNEVTKIDDSLWTDKDKGNAINNCKFGRKDADPAKLEKMCDCYLRKVIELSPNPAKQSEISTSNAIKLNADCVKESGL
ncbi:MAG: hypothetical protein DCE90_06765 [Pseudanabaena sp.]|nr:MAG: hypothetical protein DCE90_06765 [Pseudanabaena sp.]